ncbi:MAG TPA: RpiB/LacA/LacB family sugar-phosphate isomerase [Clostridiales bacterium]|jgi:ribose 5-phosphate isomerase B|nr:RpiB/LacA/LacB family sugar-phosphate isomerase [Clostridiales bacterium]
MKKVYVGCDCAAFTLKEAAKKVFAEQGYEVVDLGINTADDNTAYPEVAKRVCKAIIADDYKAEGALFCGTGIGMCITANKFPGIYAGVAHDNYACERLRLSNNANVICMGERIIGPELAKKILREWCTTSFKGGPSADKVALIKKYEKELYK